MQQFQPSLIPSYPGMPQQQQQQQQQQQYPFSSMYPPPMNMFQRGVSPVAPTMSAAAATASANPLKEFEKLWDVVIGNPNEFEYWEALVQYTSHIVKKNAVHHI